MKKILATALIAVICLGASAAYSETAYTGEYEYLKYIQSEKYPWVTMPYLGEKFGAYVYMYDDGPRIYYRAYSNCKAIVEQYDKEPAIASAYIKRKFALRDNEEIRTFVGWARMFVRLGDLSETKIMSAGTAQDEQNMKDAAPAFLDLRKNIKYSVPSVRKKAFEATSTYTEKIRAIVEASSSPPARTETPAAPSYPAPAPEPMGK